MRTLVEVQDGRGEPPSRLESCPSPSRSEVALLSHSPCSPSEREEHEAARFHNFFAGAMAAWPLATRAQQKAMPVIGVLITGSPGPTSSFVPFMAAFLQGLSEAGYVEGQNVTLEYRYAEGHYDRLPALAADLVGRKVDLIMAGSPPAALAAKGADQSDRLQGWH